MNTKTLNTEEREIEKRNLKVSNYLDHLEELFRQMPHNYLIDEAHTTLSALRSVLVYYNCC